MSLLSASLRSSFRAMSAHVARPHRSFSSGSKDGQLTFSQFPFLARLGLKESNSGVFTDKFVPGQGPTFTSINPATNEKIATISTGSKAQLEECLQAMEKAKPHFSSLPLPARGELVRQLGEALRANKADLGALVSLEMGKIAAEGLGEVQEGTHTRACMPIRTELPKQLHRPGG